MSSTTLWYVDRAAGVVSLLLLTAGVLLGVASALRVHTPRWPRFALASLHRNVALLALAFGVVHGGTSVVDDYVDIGWVDALVPFGSAYSPVWTGVGAISADLMLAVLVTTALRRRLGYSTWRSVHMLAYGCWGAAVVHSVAIGTDARLAWAAVILAGCVGAFAGAVSLRFGGRPGAQRA